MREGQMASVDTDYKLTGDGAAGTLNDYTVTSEKRIASVQVSFSPGSTAGMACLLVGFKGSAVKAGAQWFPVVAVSGVGSAVTCANLSIPDTAVDIALQAGALEAHAIISGGDTGTPEVMISWTMDDKASSGAYYLIREAQTGTADSWTTLAGTGLADTNTDILAPGSKIVQVMHLVAPGQTTGAATYGFRLVSVQGSLPTGDQTFAGLSNQAGAGTITDLILNPAVIRNVEIPCTPNKQVKIQAVMSGADQGTPEQVVGLVVLP
jgi:hypothetical protein